MDLEKILNNPVVGRIKTLQESNHELVTQLLSYPFSSKNVTARYIDNVLRIVETEKGRETRDQVIDTILTNHLHSVSKEEFIEHINNEHNHVNFLVYHLFMQYSAEAVGVDNLGDFYYFAARNTLRPDFKLMFIAKAFKSVRTLLKYMSELTPNFTDMLEMELDEEHSITGKVIFYRTMIDEYLEQYKDVFGEFWEEVLRYDDLYTQGFFTSVPKLIRSEYDSAKVERIDFDSDDQVKCKYSMAWTSSAEETIYDGALPLISRNLSPSFEFFKVVLVKNNYNPLEAGKDLVRALGDTRKVKKNFESPEFQTLLASSVRMDLEVQRQIETGLRAERAIMEAEKAVGELLKANDVYVLQAMLTDHSGDTLLPPQILSDLIVRNESRFHESLVVLKEHSPELGNKLKSAIGHMKILARDSQTSIKNQSDIDRIAVKYTSTEYKLVTLAESLEDAMDFSSRYSSRFNITIENRIENTATPDGYDKEFFLAYINIIGARIDSILERLETEKNAPRKIRVATRETERCVYIEIYDTGNSFSKTEDHDVKSMFALVEEGNLDRRIISSTQTVRKYQGKLLFNPIYDHPEFTTKTSIELPKGTIL